MGQLTKSDYTFLLRRLHSLTGIVPIGGFLLFHFFENASARHGADSFNKTVEEIGRMPYLVVLEWLALLLPIAFHSIYGLYITSSAKPNIVKHTYGRNFAYLMQRVTGILGFFYLGYHIITTRMWALFVKGSDITYADMHTKLQSPLALCIYIVGIISLTYHFSNGIWSFSVTWGIVKTESGQKKLAIATNLFFIILCTVGLDILSAFIFDKSILSHLGI